MPTPNTTVVRDDARFGHFTQASTRVRNPANAAAFTESAETMRVGAGGDGLENSPVARGLGMAIAGIGRTTGFGAAGAAGAIAAGRLVANVAGNASERSVSAETLTFRVPLDFKSSRCVIVASSS